MLLPVGVEVVAQVIGLSAGLAVPALAETVAGEVGDEHEASTGTVASLHERPPWRVVKRTGRTKNKRRIRSHRQTLCRTGREATWGGGSPPPPQAVISETFAACPVGCRGLVPR